MSGVVDNRLHETRGICVDVAEAPRGTLGLIVIFMRGVMEETRLACAWQTPSVQGGHWSPCSETGVALFEGAGVVGDASGPEGKVPPLPVKVPSFLWPNGLRTVDAEESHVELR